MTSIRVQESYLMVKGRLRLGRIRSIFSISLIKLPITLGLYWLIWVDEVEKELNWHLEGKIHEKKTWQKMIYAVPGFHLLACRRISGLMEQVEAQNHYNQFSKCFAAIYSLLPPLYLIYLQHNLNRHWFLHANFFSLKAPRETI